MEIQSIVNLIIEVFNDVWGAIVAISSALGAVWYSWRRYRKEQEDTIDNKLTKYYDELKLESEKVKLKEKELAAEIAQLKEQNQIAVIDYITLKTKWETILGVDPEKYTPGTIAQIMQNQKNSEASLRDFVLSFPGIMWMKKRISKNNYIIEVVSREYAKKLLDVAAEETFGKRDIDFWPKEISDIFKINDEKIFVEGIGRPIKLVEKIFNPKVQSLTPDSTLDWYFIGWKWVLQLSKNDVYVCGYGDIYSSDDPFYIKTIEGEK